MIVFDFDGVIVKSGFSEKILRWILKKIRISPPKIFFLLFELANKPSEVNPDVRRIIYQRNGKNKLVGLITDRSLFSLAKFFEQPKIEEINLASFNFIQTRKSFLDRFSGLNNLIGELENPRLFTSDYLKPNIMVLDNLKNFALEKNIKLDEITIIDDLKEMQKKSKQEGFKIAAVP